MFHVPATDHYILYARAQKINTNGESFTIVHSKSKETKNETLITYFTKKNWFQESKRAKKI